MFLDHFQFSLEVDLYKLVVMELLEMDKPILLQDYLVFLKGFTITKYKSVLQTILMQNSKILKEACHRENSEFIKVHLHIQFPKMNMDHLLNLPNLNGVILRGQDLSNKYLRVDLCVSGTCECSQKPLTVAKPN